MITVTTAGGDVVLLADDDNVGVAAVMRLGAEVVKPVGPADSEEPRLADARLALADCAADAEADNDASMLEAVPEVAAREDEAGDIMERRMIVL